MALSNYGSDFPQPSFPWNKVTGNMVLSPLPKNSAKCRSTKRIESRAHLATVYKDLKDQRARTFVLLHKCRQRQTPFSKEIPASGLSHSWGDFWFAASRRENHAALGERLRDLHKSHSSQRWIHRSQTALRCLQDSSLEISPDFLSAISPDFHRPYFQSN